MTTSGTASSGSVLGTLLDGRYQVRSVLARGGMSTVYRGVDTRLDRPVAVKVMDPRFAGDQSFLDRFHREARATAKLRHPSVVAVYDQGVDRGGHGSARDGHDHVFLVMELVDGGTLRDLLRRLGRLPVPLAIAVLEPVLSALAAAHREGLVHRDIKPENVLIGRGGEVKVADFGLVRAIAEAGSTSGNVILGTVAYLSPEQVATGAADARSDVYAAGVVLYELLTGVPPYTGDTALSVAYRHVNDDVPPPGHAVGGVPALLDDLVVRATRRDPAGRPADAAAFLHALQRVRTELGVRRVPVPAPLVVERDDDDPETTRDLRGLHDDSPTRPERGARPSPVTERADRAAGAGVGAAGPSGTRAFTRAPLVTPPRRDAHAHADAVRRPEPHGSPHRPPQPPDPYLAQRARDRKLFVIWLVVVLLVTAAVGFGAWHLAVGRWTAVPELENLDRAGIEAALRDAGLDPEVTDDHHDTVPAGVVLSADPAPGARVLRGRDVEVVLSQGRPVVPDVAAGTAFDEAARRLRDTDLEPRRDDAEFSDTVPAGAALRLQPPPGTQLTVGAVVTVVVSRGPTPVAVPEVRGRTVEEAIAALAQAGLTANGEPTQRFDDEIPGGRVVGTEPEAGDETPRGSDVVLVVSTALTVPDVVGKPRQEALAMLRDAGFDPVESGDGAGNDAARAYATDPDIGDLVDPGDRRLTVELSTTVGVPLVMGKSVGEARRLLERLGLAVEVSSFTGGDGSTVVGQNPGPGGRLAPGATVQLTAFP